MLDFWRPTRLFDGERVFVLGGGPSLRGVDLTRLRERACIAVNQMGHLAPWSQVLFFSDASWMRQPANLALVASWRGLVLTSSHRAQHTLPEKVRRVHFERGRRPELHPPGSHAVGWGRSSGHKAVSLAHTLGASRIVMLGFDCRRDAEGHSHAHDAYSHRDESAMRTWLEHWEGWGEAARRAGAIVVNASPGSAVREFPATTLDEELA